MARILVIGGAGYIGSHACKAFAASGAQVAVFDNLSQGSPDLVKWGPLIEGDILERPALDAAMASWRPDLVVHFAALTSVADSVVDPGAYYRTNILGTINVLDAMRAAGVGSLVFSSTAAVYGHPQAELIDENHPQAPINPYGFSKFAAERIIADYGAAYGISAIALRYFNAAGADPDGDTGERHDPETHLIPLAARGLLDEAYVFTIFGDDFDTPDGTAVRDYVHVSDLALAHVAAAELLLAGGGSDRINLGSNHGASVAEVVAALESVSGRTLARRIGPRRAGDLARLVASNVKARAMLNWVPRQSSIDHIVKTAWRWHTEFDRS